MKTNRKHFSDSFKRKIAEKFNFTCAYCGKSGLTSESKDYAIDHIIPLKRGGTNDESNLQLLCFSCNAKKGTRTQDEFIEHMRKREELERMLNELDRIIPDLPTDTFRSCINSVGKERGHAVVKSIYEYIGGKSNE